MNFLTGKNILLISPESWEHLFVSKHNYSIALAAQGNTVYFLNPPGDKFDVSRTAYNNVFQIRYTPFIKGLRFFPSVVQKFFFRQKYHAIERLIGKKIDIVWSFDNSVFFDYSFLPRNVFSISHIVDYSQDFQLATAARTANICFGVSPVIVSRLKAYNHETYLVPHGIHTRHEIADGFLPGQNKVKAVYAGNLDSIYLDKESLHQIIKGHPEVDFIFFGSGGRNFFKASNVFQPGVVPNHLLMHYLKQADVLLLLYDTKRYPDQLTNAHKVLEYLFAGKVIVSSYLSDYQDKRELIEMSDDQRSVVDVFDETIRSLAVLNSDERRARRYAFALENTYENRIREIEVLICNLSNKKQ